VRPIGINTGIIITVTADERQRYEKARGSGPFLFVTTITVIPGQPAGLNPESRSGESQTATDSPMCNCTSEVRAYARPGMTYGKIWQHRRHYAIEKPAPRQWALP
jgi:hypothetical protein